MSFLLPLGSRRATRDDLFQTFPLGRARERRESTTRCRRRFLCHRGGRRRRIARGGPRAWRRQCLQLGTELARVCPPLIRIGYCIKKWRETWLGATWLKNAANIPSPFSMMMELDLGTAAPAIKHHQSSTGVGGGNGERRRVPQNCDSKSLTGTPAASHHRHQ